MRKNTYLRWWIAALLAGAAILNYVDRQTLSALAPTIQADLGMDDRSYANVVNLFLAAYAVAYLVCGRIADRIGSRSGMALFVVWWSLANALTALTQGVRTLGCFRFALGLGAAGIWPAASKAVSEWFPAKERALAIGVYTMGATVGAAVAPHVAIPLATVAYDEVWPSLAGWPGAGVGWRVAFVLTGLAGFLWLVPWLWLDRLPREPEPVARTDAPAHAAADPAWGWLRVLRFKSLWLLLAGRLVTDPVWYFYQFWFPKYLSAGRQLEQGQLTISWIVYAAAGVGSLAGGWLSGNLVKRGMPPVDSRLRVMLACACLMPLSALVARVSNLNLALALMAVTVAASLAWLININALVVDLVPPHSVGTVFSVVAAGSTVGGIAMNMLVASMAAGPACGGGFLDRAFGAVLAPLFALVQGHGYAQWFCVMAVLHPLAWLVLKQGGLSGENRACRSGFNCG